jgi:hypothetical protein
MGIAAGAASGFGAYSAGAAGIMGMSAMSFGTAASIGLTVGSSVIQLGAASAANRADRLSAGLEERQYSEQAKRYKEQADAQELETTTAIINRKREYLRNLSTNTAWMGASGITVSSASNRNLLQDNYQTYRDDVSAIGLMGTEARYASISLAQDALTAKESVAPLLKAKQTKRKYDTISSIATQAAEIGTKIGSSTPGTPKTKKTNLLKGTSTRQAQNYEKLRRKLLGKEYGY